MKDIYKNPLFYYILIPAVAAIWPAVMWGVYLPGTSIALNDDIEQYKKAMQLFEELRNVDPERLDFAKEKGAKADFDYAAAVQQTASFCSIPAANCEFSSNAITTSEGQKSQTANVSLKDIDITKAARFLSTIQLRWPGLQCTKINLRKKKGLPDSWDADFTFKYFY
jgi:hypothetical protein